MRLGAIRVRDLRQALELYQSVAFAGKEQADAVPVKLEGNDDAPVADVLQVFTDEAQQAGGAVVHRYVIRLGNARYPFMKLVLQEHLVEGEFFFEVDTHDQMFELEGGEEQAFLELKHYNLSVKERVETAWAEARLPTASHLKGLVETRPASRVEPNGRTVLVVDDDECIASTLALLLEGRGYSVTCLCDGLDVVELADPQLHDLILMDNEMKHLNGFEACRVLKSRPETAKIPVLIATAGALTLQQLDAADGFLVKPFRAELLFSMLEHLLPDPPAL
ncbi:MAG: hypothetical protein DHS20C15_02820 [Planctomycetota bacterium]|nr:MAG: hypothetical protein DHS20C15_02820 [Planctomycetota bacterium]